MSTDSKTLLDILQHAERLNRMWKFTDIWGCLGIQPTSQCYEGYRLVGRKVKDIVSG